MKKVVFKGVINGETFDNVKDYNNRMSSLIAEGVNVDAHSETKLISNSDDQENKCDESQNKCIIRKEDILPYFGEDADNEYYLDRYVTGDPSLDEKSLAAMREKLQIASDKFEKYVHGCDNVEELLSLVYDIKSFKNMIESDRKNNDEVAGIIRKSIEESYSQLRVMESAAEFINVLHDYYQYAFDKLKNALLLGF